MCACEQKELAFPAGAGECEEWPISPLKSVYHELAHLLDHLPVTRPYSERGRRAAWHGMAPWTGGSVPWEPMLCHTRFWWCATRVFACMHAMCVCARVRACTVV